MGGREAVRGFAIQALVCLLDALEPGNDWTAVTVEPDSANDKVDILWELPEGRRLAQQVKSSKNIIGRGAVVTWCRELKQSQAADRYQLLLSGPLAQAALDDVPFDGVEVPPPSSIDTLALMDQAIAKLDRYLSDKTIAPTPIAIREAIVVTVSSKILDGSIRGDSLKRETFDGLLVNWILAAYPQAIEHRMVANCEVLWSTVTLAGPINMNERAFHLVLPLTVVNGGLSVVVVEWFRVKVDGVGRQMRYLPSVVLPEGSISQTVDRSAGIPFGEFAVLPGSARTANVLFVPLEGPGLATDMWPEQDVKLELFVKYGALPEFRSVRKVTLASTADHRAVLGTTRAVHISTVPIDAFV
ncbi:hypothetical protein [Mesorhizobium sp. M0306]|uniref:hypothetical protein n=1 Tax=unclassified Mesorhizobium TaxID=325217 RepID=UPI003337949A